MSASISILPYCSIGIVHSSLFFMRPSSLEFEFLNQEFICTLKSLCGIMYSGYDADFTRLSSKREIHIFPDFPLNFRKRLTCKNSNLTVCATNAHKIFFFLFAFRKKRNLHALVWTMAWWVTTPGRRVHPKKITNFIRELKYLRDKSRIV